MDMPDAEIMQGFYLVLTVFLGLCFGSFATALSYRLPRGLSMIKMARSACPSCGHALGVPDLVPVFSWLFLRGKCRHCKAAIGWRYPLIELATLALCLAFFYRFGFSPALLAVLCLAPLLVSIIDIDLHYKIIPDTLNVSMAGLALAGLVLAAPDAASPPDFIINAGETGLLGCAFYGGGSFALRQIAMWAMKREPMGLGDVKFFAVAGLWLGDSPDTLAYFLFVSGAAGVLFALYWQKIKKEKEFPFGPALMLAFIAIFLWQGPFFWLT
jgi:leader peptidase (prepilin peptidase)/N-methyltransferase